MSSKWIIKYRAPVVRDQRYLNICFSNRLCVYTRYYKGQQLNTWRLPVPYIETTIKTRGVDIVTFRPLSLFHSSSIQVYWIGVTRRLFFCFLLKPTLSIEPKRSSACLVWLLFEKKRIKKKQNNSRRVSVYLWPTRLARDDTSLKLLDRILLS